MGNPQPFAGGGNGGVPRFLRAESSEGTASQGQRRFGALHVTAHVRRAVTVGAEPIHFSTLHAFR